MSAVAIEGDSVNKRLVVYEEGTEKTVSAIQLLDGTGLCTGDSPVVPIESLTNVTQLKIVLTSGVTVIANIQ